jgi:hypothetical protein
MSLNRYEQTLFTYWERNPDERRHWQSKTAEIGKGAVVLLDAARMLERELWPYLLERGAHVAEFRNLQVSAAQRVSLLNLAEYMLRLWGPVPKPKKPQT